MSSDEPVDRAGVCGMVEVVGVVQVVVGEQMDLVLAFLVQVGTGIVNWLVRVVVGENDVVDDFGNGCGA